eukprot:scaffold7328_cov314-Pinguiococcus_pyrenoidosus.AAC.18
MVCLLKSFGDCDLGIAACWSRSHLSFAICSLCARSLRESREICSRRLTEVLVDLGPGHDPLRDRRIPQRADRLLQVRSIGSHGRDDGCLGVATERLFQQPGEHRVSIG